MTEVDEYNLWLKELKESRWKYMSQYSMATDLGISQAELSRILSGKRTGKELWMKTRNNIG